MMKTRWIISFARLPVSVKNPNAAPVEGNIVPELIGTNNSDKQIWELVIYANYSKLINMIYWFYRNKIAALFGIDRVGKILTDCLSDTL